VAHASQSKNYLVSKMECSVTQDRSRSARRSHAPQQIAGVLDFRFHDLRDTAASWLRMSGADIHLRMAARYQHLSPAFMADAVAKLDAVFDAERHHSVTEVKMLEAGSAATV
jgi:hypothetical protein